MQLESFGFLHLVHDLTNVRNLLFHVNLGNTRVLQLCYQVDRALLVHMLLDSLDVALEVYDAFLDRRNICSESLALGDAPRFYYCNVVARASKLSFELAQIVNVLLLQLLVLNFDNLEVVLV